MGMFHRLFHRHTWKPLKTLYRYREYTRYRDRHITVKRCQCYECGKIRTIHFEGKDIVY